MLCICNPEESKLQHHIKEVTLQLSLQNIIRISSQHRNGRLNLPLPLEELLTKSTSRKNIASQPWVSFQFLQSRTFHRIRHEYAIEERLKVEAVGFHESDTHVHTEAQ